MLNTGYRVCKIQDKDTGCVKYRIQDTGSVKYRIQSVIIDYTGCDKCKIHVQGVLNTGYSSEVCSDFGQKSKGEVLSCEGSSDFQSATRKSEGHEFTTC